MTLVAVALAGGLGALVRYEMGGRLSARVPGIPVGTLAVNVVGSVLTGALASAGPGTGAAAILGAGFLGGFTTFSTWMVETVAIGTPGAGGHPPGTPTAAQTPRPALAATNLAVMLALGLLGAWWGSSI